MTLETGPFAVLLVLFQAYILLTIFFLLLDNREPAETFAWIFVFILMPGVGLVIYWIAGHEGRKRYERRGKKIPQLIDNKLSPIFRPLEAVQEDIIRSVKDRGRSYQDDLMMLLYRNSKALITSDNRVTFFHDGASKFDALIADIEKAERFVHLEYFIWYSDQDALGRRMKELLVRKAKEGVEIRILYDHFGCLWTMRRAYRNELRKAGVKIYPFFNYLSEFRSHTLNHRNHRKIVVIDGRVGYTGGMNIGQEYIDGGKRFRCWRDTHLRLEGGCVSLLEAVFAVDWFNTTDEEACFDPRYYLRVQESAEAGGSLPMQLPTSGFDTRWPSLLHLYFTMITMAQKSITIVSPYFVPETSLLTALKTAAMRGLDVTVLMTGVPDNPFPYWAAFSYFDELLAAGVKVFQYQKGFMHAKMISVDGKVCSAGTANFDIRSLKLNYEVNAVFYDEATTRELDVQIARDLKECRQITAEDLKAIRLPVRLRNSLARLLSNIL